MSNQQHPFWRYLSSSGSVVFIFVMAIIVGLFAWLRPQFGGDPVYLEVEAPVDIFVPDTVQTVPVDLTLNLVNTTRDPVTLAALNDCYVLRWLVLDQADTIVQSHTLDACGDDPLELELEPNASLVTRTTLTFNPRRMPPGNRYRLVLRYWGYEAETTLRFRVPRD